MSNFVNPTTPSLSQTISLEVASNKSSSSERPKETSTNEQPVAAQASSLDLSVGIAARNNTAQTSYMSLAPLIFDFNTKGLSHEEAAKLEELEQVKEMEQISEDYAQLYVTDYRLVDERSVDKFIELYQRTTKSLIQLIREEQLSTKMLYDLLEETYDFIKRCIGWEINHQPYDDFFIRAMQKISKTPNAFNRFIRIPSSAPGNDNPVEIDMNMIFHKIELIEKLFGKLKIFKLLDSGMKLDDTSKVILDIGNLLLMLAFLLHQKENMSGLLFYSLTRKLQFLQQYCMWVETGKPEGHFQLFIISEPMQKLSAENYFGIYLSALLPPDASDEDRKALDALLNATIKKLPVTVTKTNAARRIEELNKSKAPSAADSDRGDTKAPVTAGGTPGDQKATAEPAKLDSNPLQDYSASAVDLYN